jgi:hypothetical protein
VIDARAAGIVAVTADRLQKTEVDSFTVAVPGAVHVST